ncbi:MAG: hypothetical protein AYK22_02925 [Thermoplasmatales archaeon SG8-52-3]|nr:MAG: hypothetical protein AYK22_02925 [Thermoplasmatales archaeon SG8-52-3]
MKNKLTIFVTLAIFLFSIIGSPTVSAIDETTILPFGIYDQYRNYWDTYPEYMVNQDEEDYTNTTTIDDSEFISTDIMLEDLGTITKVELRANGYWTDAQRSIVLQPYFSGIYPGDDHTFNPPENEGNWSNWMEITSDTNAHAYWDWTDFEDLCCLVRVGGGNNGFNLWCSQVEIRITYTPE